MVKIATAATLLASLPASSRADQNWDGDNAVGNFSYNNNWYSDVQPSYGFGNGNFHFSYHNSASQSSLYDDYGSLKDTNDIFWDTTFNAGLTLSGSSGSAINFNQRLENQSSFTQTVMLPLSGGKNGSSQIELNPVNGNLVLNGPLYNDNNVSWAVYGSNGKTLTLATALNGTGAGFTLQQNSTVLFNSSNGYTGTTTVNAGVLLVNSSQASSSGYTVNSSGKLGGNGSISAPVTLASGSTISAGSSSANGKLTLSNTAIAVSSGSTFSYKINGTTAGTSYDQLSIGATTFNLNGATLSLSDPNGYFLAGGAGFFKPGLKFTLIDRGVGLSAAASLFNGLGQNAAFNAADTRFTISYTGGDGNDVELTTVPEPASGFMAMTIGASILARRKRKRLTPA